MLDFITNLFSKSPEEELRDLTFRSVYDSILNHPELWENSPYDFCALTCASLKVRVELRYDKLMADITNSSGGHITTLTKHQTKKIFSLVRDRKEKEIKAERLKSQLDQLDKTLLNKN